MLPSRMLFGPERVDGAAERTCTPRYGTERGSAGTRSSTFSSPSAISRPSRSRPANGSTCNPLSLFYAPFLPYLSTRCLPKPSTFSSLPANALSPAPRSLSWTLHHISRTLSRWDRAYLCALPCARPAIMIASPPPTVFPAPLARLLLNCRRDRSMFASRGACSRVVMHDSVRAVSVS